LKDGYEKEYDDAEKDRKAKEKFISDAKEARE
jgi:hypothetical protein